MGDLQPPQDTSSDSWKGKSTIKTTSFNNLSKEKVKDFSKYRLSSSAAVNERIGDLTGS